MVQQNWIRVLLEAVKQADEQLRTEQTPDGTAYYFTGEFLDAVYYGILRHGMDFRRSSYNDVRLEDFIRLFIRLDGSEDDPVRALRDMAGTEGVRLPEIRKRSQLEAVNEYLYSAARKNGYTHSFRLWMPVLPEHILLEEITDCPRIRTGRRAGGQAVDPVGHHRKGR